MAIKLFAENLPSNNAVTILSGIAGVFSGFAKPVLRIAKEMNLDPRDIFFALGHRKVVGGQEDLILEAAQELARQKQASAPPNPDAAMTLADKSLALIRTDAESVLSCRTESLAPLAGSQVFISGGSGFLGTWLLELIAVLNERHTFGLRVTVFSRNARAFAIGCPHLGNHPWVRFVDGDTRYL